MKSVFNISLSLILLNLLSCCPESQITIIGVRGAYSTSSISSVVGSKNVKSRTSVGILYENICDEVGINASLIYTKYGLKDISPNINENYYSIGLLLGIKKYQDNYIGWIRNPKKSPLFYYGLSLGIYKFFDKWSGPNNNIGKTEETYFSITPYIGLDQKITDRLGLFLGLGLTNFISKSNKPNIYLEFDIGFRYIVF